MKAMATFLVTGGAGFIGSHIVEQLLSLGHNVRVVDNFSTGRRENLQSFIKDIELIEGDIRDIDFLHSNFRGVDYVLHQAALPSVQRSISDPLTTHEVNATGTLNVLIAARDTGVKRVVYASSSSVYGDTEELPKHEEMKPNPKSPYAVAKLVGEYYCQVFSRVYGLEVVVLRYFNVFGPRQNPDSPYAAVIPRFLRALRNDEPLVIYGDGEQSRDFTPVENVVRANIAACYVPLNDEFARSTGSRKEGEHNSSGISFLLANVGTGERRTLNELVRELCRLFDKQIEPVYVPPRPSDIKHSLASIEILKKRLGLQQLISFTEALTNLVNAGIG